MYRVAIQRSSAAAHLPLEQRTTAALYAGARLEPSALCNYATFLYRQRKNPLKAQKYFLEGLNKYPAHKGLVKNFGAFLKANPSLGSFEDFRILHKMKLLKI